MPEMVEKPNRGELPKRLEEAGRPACAWLLFFLTCLGLGYPTLNRYDPAQASGTSDAGVYRDLVVRGAPPEVGQAPDTLARLGQAENYYRLLVPGVARPFYLLMNGHTGSWDAALFALLIANALFTATTAGILVAVGCRLGLTHATALLAATFYLLNFAVANLNLAGLVDSGEACIMMAIVWSLLTGRWYLLPLWGVAGALAKETFAPLSAIFAAGWWLAGREESRRMKSRMGWICGLALASVLTVTITMSAVAREWVWPWEFAGAVRDRAGFFAGLEGCLLNHTFWYVFAWLLPLGLVRLRRLPRTWIMATGLAAFAALALGAYNNAGGNTARALFNLAGPPLSLSVAVLLAEPDATFELNPKASREEAGLS